MHSNSLPFTFQQLTLKTTLHNLLAADPMHGGISFDVHRRACPSHLLPLLDGAEVVEWHRVQAYQDVSLKLILQQILQGLAEKRGNDQVYLRREVVREPLRPLPILPRGSFHLYYSRHNVGASNFAKLLEMYHTAGGRTASGRFQSRQQSSMRLQRSSALRNLLSAVSSNMSPPLKVTSDPRQMTRGLHFLCYLNAKTHTSGSTTAKFHMDLERALQAGMHILLVHETRVEAGGAPFKEIIDATPEELKWDSDLAQKRLYKELAVMICGSVSTKGANHLNVGLHLLLNAVSAPGKHAMDATVTDTDDVLVDEETPELRLSTVEEEAESHLSEPHSGVVQDAAENVASLPPPAQVPFEESGSSTDGSRKLYVAAALEHTSLKGTVIVACRLYARHRSILLRWPLARWQAQAADARPNLPPAVRL